MDKEAVQMMRVPYATRPRTAMSTGMFTRWEN